MQVLCKFKTISLESTSDVVSIEQIYFLFLSNKNSEQLLKGYILYWKVVSDTSYKKLFILSHLYSPQTSFRVQEKHLIWEIEASRFLSLDIGLLPLLLSSPSKAFYTDTVQALVQKGHISKKNLLSQEHLLLKIKSEIRREH